MTDTTTLQSTPSTQPRERARPIGGFFEDIFETVTGTGPGYTNEAPFKGTLEDLKSLPEHKVSTFLSTGELTGFQKPRSERSDAELIAEQRAAVAEADRTLRQSRISEAEFTAEEEVRLEVAGMPEEDRNRRLHLNRSFRKKNTETAYHMHEVYKQVKAEQRQLKQQTNMEIPSPAKQPSASEGVFEGRSGTQGAGVANLSFQATG